jgi:hypothetical protein
MWARSPADDMQTASLHIKICKLGLQLPGNAGVPPASCWKSKFPNKICDIAHFSVFRQRAAETAAFPGQKVFGIRCLVGRRLGFRFVYRFFNPRAAKTAALPGTEAPTQMIYWLMMTEMPERSRFPTSLSWRLFPVQVRQYHHLRRPRHPPFRLRLHG